MVIRCLQTIHHVGIFTYGNDEIGLYTDGLITTDR